jgi:hypothetical protein
MKSILKLFPLLLLFFLGGCFEIQEDIDVKSNGSGQMTVNMDMSQLLALMQNYLGKEEMDKQMPQKSIDTTVFMKDLVDTAKSIPADKKALLRNGKLHMVLNMTDKVFKTDLHFPFNNLTDLQKIYTSLNDGSLNTTSLFKGLTGGHGDSADNANNNATPDMSQFNSIYDFQSRDGLVSRKLNAERWKALQDNPQFGQMKDVGSMGVEMPYTLTIKLPRPVKKVDNALAKLSDDKKTVTIKYNLTEVFQNPEKFEYTISY